MTAVVLYQWRADYTNTTRRIYSISLRFAQLRKLDEQTSRNFRFDFLCEEQILLVLGRTDSVVEMNDCRTLILDESHYVCDILDLHPLIFDILR